MRVYCDDTDCRNNNNGKCENRFPTGEEAIMLHFNDYGVLICTDYEEKDNSEEDDGK